MRALDIAVAEPRYRFLVYNVSVVFWRVARPLQRPGRFPAILAPMRRVADAIRDALGPDDTEWKARFGLGLAQAYDGADQPDEAISALGERTPLPPGGPCPGFSFRVASMPCAGMQPDARPRGLAWKSWDLRSNVQCAASPQVLPAACCRHTCPSLVGSQSLSHSSCALLLEYIIASDLFHQRL